jgi:hypothetical protein
MRAFPGVFWHTGTETEVCDSVFFSFFMLVPDYYRNVLYDQLLALHQRGVFHGDFMLRNVLLHGDRTTIVEFSNSQLKHIYPGSTYWKLLEAKQALGIEATLAQDEGVRYHS